MANERPRRRRWRSPSEMDEIFNHARLRRGMRSKLPVPETKDEARGRQFVQRLKMRLMYGYLSGIQPDQDDQADS